MPIYLYVCTKCPCQFEKIQKMDNHNPECPECGSETEKGIAKVSPFVWGRGGAYLG